MAEEYHMKVSRIPWDPNDYPLNQNDYIFGMILEIPEMYYIVPDMSMAYVYILGRGMVRLKHNFHNLDERQTALLIEYVRRDLSC